MGSMGAPKARHRIGGASAAGQLLPLLPTQPIECQHGHSHGNGQMCHGHFGNPASSTGSTLTRTLSEFMNECATAMMMAATPVVLFPSQYQRWAEQHASPLIAAQIEVKQLLTKTMVSAG